MPPCVRSRLDLVASVVPHPSPPHLRPQDYDDRGKRAGKRGRGGGAGAGKGKRAAAAARRAARGRGRDEDDEESEESFESGDDSDDDSEARRPAAFISIATAVTYIHASGCKCCFAGWLFAPGRSRFSFLRQVERINVLLSAGSQVKSTLSCCLGVCVCASLF